MHSTNPHESPASSINSAQVASTSKQCFLQRELMSSVGCDESAASSAIKNHLLSHWDDRNYFDIEIQQNNFWPCNEAAIEVVRHVR